MGRPTVRRSSDSVGLKAGRCVTVGIFNGCEGEITDRPHSKESVMSIVFYPSNLSPYPSASPVAVRRVDAQDYPKWDGLCIKLGPWGVSVSWRRS